VRQLSFSNATTLGGMLQERASGPQGEDIRMLFAGDMPLPGIEAPKGDDKSIVLSYAQAYDLALRAASCFRRFGVRPGDRILLFLSTGPAFLAAFYGCQIAGAIAVPFAPPRFLSHVEGYLTRVARICEPSLTVVEGRFMPFFRIARGRSLESRSVLKNVVEDTDLFLEQPSVSDPHPAQASDPAILQFTSGSTGTPKGVTLSHANLFANIRGIGLASGFQDGDLALCWLPLFHDMGLIAHMLTSALWRVALVLMPPEIFISRPSSWLKALSRYEAAHSTAPNFAYLLCVRKIADREIENVDLSHWRVAYCGAEPIQPETIRRFTERFAAKGFKPTSFFPVYGLAEFTVGAVFPTAMTLPRYDQVDRQSLERDGIARPARGDGTPDQIESVSVGRALPGHSMRLVDSGGLPVEERRVGEIELSGPSLMLGYYRNPEATREVVREGWLRTGDLGYIADGDLFVTGRSKDLIIKAGRNIYPQDVEHAASSVEGVRAGCCAAFAVANRERGVEELVLICETKVSAAKANPKLPEAIRARILSAIGASVDVIKLVDPGTVLKTSSGKIRRQEMRDLYLRGNLKTERLPPLMRLRIIAEAARWRLSRMVLRNRQPRNFSASDRSL
jgi:fatty-acyl-CoA synthase